MDRPEPNMPATDKSTCSAAPADAWGDKEVAREIALLEAHLSEDKVTRAIEKAFAAVEGLSPGSELAKEILPVNIEDELRQSYLDYAISVIVGRALPCDEAIRNIQTLSRRAIALFPFLAHRLAAALAIHLLSIAEKACSALLLKLRKSAESALYGLPLFAYGPEVSEFRHRHR